MNTMTINGKQMQFSGRNISYVNGKLTVDGREVTIEDSNAPVINIIVEGNAGDISGDFAEITVNGVAETVNSMSGDVSIKGNVGGKVKTMSGDVKVRGSVNGDVKTMSGDIRSGFKWKF